MLFGAPMPCGERMLCGARMPLLPTNAVPLLRREAANERTPVSIHGPEGIRDVFVPHPNRAVLIGDCGGVVAPTSYAAAGAELSVSGEAVVGQCAEGGN